MCVKLEFLMLQIILKYFQSLKCGFTGGGLIECNSEKRYFVKTPQIVSP